MSSGLQAARRRSPASTPGSSAALCATARSAAPAATSTSSSRATPGAPPARSPRRPAARPASSSRASSAPGGSSRATAPGSSTSSRCAAGIWRATSRCATSPSTRSRSRCTAASRSIRSGACATSPTGGCGWPAQGAFAADPLRVLRLVRVVVELELEPDAPALRRGAGQRAGTARGLRRARVRRAVPPARRPGSAPRPRADGRASGPWPLVLPELEALRGVEQSRYHHLDVYGHTLEVLDRTVALTRPGGPGEGGASRAALLAPGRGLGAADRAARGRSHARHGAALGSAAARRRQAAHARRTRAERPCHVHRTRRRAAPSSRARCSAGCAPASVCARTSRGSSATTCAWASSCTSPSRWRAGTVFDYLLACEPVEVDVTLLSIADRLATRGARAEEAIGAHLALGAQMLDAALSWRARGAAARRCCAATSSRVSWRSRRARGSARCWTSSRGRSTPARSRTREQALTYVRARRRERSRLAPHGRDRMRVLQDRRRRAAVDDRRRRRAHDRLHGHRARHAGPRARDPARALRGPAHGRAPRTSQAVCAGRAAPRRRGWASASEPTA